MGKKDKKPKEKKLSKKEQQAAEAAAKKAAAAEKQKQAAEEAAKKAAAAEKQKQAADAEKAAAAVVTAEAEKQKSPAEPEPHPEEPVPDHSAEPAPAPAPAPEPEREPEHTGAGTVRLRVRGWTKAAAAASLKSLQQDRVQLRLEGLGEYTLETYDVIAEHAAAPAAGASGAGLTRAELEGKRKFELRNICKSRGLDPALWDGSKEQLIERLLSCTSSSTAQPESAPRGAVSQSGADGGDPADARKPSTSSATGGGETNGFVLSDRIAAAWAAFADYPVESLVRPSGSAHGGRQAGAASTVFEAWSQLQALSVEAEAKDVLGAAVDAKDSGGARAVRGVQTYHRLRKLVMQGQAAGASTTTRSVFESLDAQLRAHIGAGPGSNLGQHGIVVVGAGPAGLRVAIELALVGAQVAVVEQSFDCGCACRPERMVLWSTTARDLEELGAAGLGWTLPSLAAAFGTKSKQANSMAGSTGRSTSKAVGGTMAAGALQLLYLKVALMLGVEVGFGVRYVGCRHRGHPLSSGPAPWQLQLKEVLVSEPSTKNSVRDYRGTALRSAATELLNAWGTRQSEISQQRPPVFALLGACGPQIVDDAAATIVAAAVYGVNGAAAGQGKLLRSDYGASGIVGWSAWERPLLSFPNLQVPAEGGAGQGKTRWLFDLRESSEGLGGALQLQPHMLSTLDLAWDFEGDTQAVRGETMLSEHDGTPKRLLYDPELREHAMATCGLELEAVGYHSTDSGDSTKSDTGVAGVGKTTTVHSWTASVRIASLVQAGVLAPLALDPLEILSARLQATEPELYALILCCRGWEVQSDNGKVSGERAVRRMSCWREPERVIQLLFRTANAVLIADTTRGSSNALVENMLSNLGHPDFKKAAMRLGPAPVAGGYYPRLSKAARDLLADWAAAHSGELQQAWPRLPAVDSFDSSSSQPPTAATPVTAACTAICVAMPSADGTTSCVMPYAVDITRLEHAARTISGCWEGYEWFKDDACAHFVLPTDNAADSGGTSGTVSVGCTVEVGAAAQPNIRFGSGCPVRLGGGSDGFCASRACCVAIEAGAPLLVGLVGDALFHNEWVSGYGVNRALLSALDTAWLVRSAAALGPSVLGRDGVATAKVLNEREKLYHLSKRAMPPPTGPSKPGAVLLGVREGWSIGGEPMRRYTTEALARALPHDGDFGAHGSYLTSVYEHKPQEVCWPDNAPAGTVVWPLTPDRWEPLEATATGRLVLPVGGVRNEEGQTPKPASDSAATAGGRESMSGLQQYQRPRGQATVSGEDLLPMHFRMALETNAIGARKHAKPAKRQQFEESVIADLAQLLGVAEKRLQISIVHSDDDDDVPLE